MANVTTRRQGEMIQTLFRVLETAEEGLQARDALSLVEDALPPTDFERATYPNNPDLVRFPKLVRFASINAVKAGWMTKENGVWKVTSDGISALEKFPDPEEFFLESRRLYESWKKDQPNDPESADDETVDAQSIDATALEEAEDQARQAILRHLGVDLNPYEFQDLVGKLIQAMGHYVLWVAPKGPDGGLDLLAQADPLGAEGRRIKGQVKRRPGDKATVDELRSFISLIGTDEVGVFISLGGFSKDAEAKSRDANRRVTLIDGPTLIDLWIEHYEKIDEEGQQLFPLRAVHFLDKSKA
jgi:restriction system protein